MIFLFFDIAHAEPATEDSIRELLLLSGSESAMIEATNKIAVTLRVRAQDIPEDLWRELTRTDSTIKNTIAVYRKYFTETEMQDLIAFYKTPTGKKLSSLLPKMSNEIFEREAQEARMTILNYYIQKGNFEMVKKINDNDRLLRSNTAPLQSDTSPTTRP
jgi:hypothetical protein